MIFLNCTKNTELTAPLFARTFVLALRKKNCFDSAETVTGVRQNADFSSNVSSTTTVHTEREELARYS